MPSCLVVVMPRLTKSCRHRLEIVVGLLAILLQRRLMPGRTELAAAADVGEHKDAALVEPQHAEVRRIARRQRNLEAAIAVENGRRGACVSFGRDHEIRNLRAVFRRGFELFGSSRWRRTAPAAI